MAPLDVLRWVVAFSAVGSVIGGLEWLYLRAHLRDDGIYSWKVERATAGALKRSLGGIFDYPIVLAIPAAQVVLSLALLVPTLPPQAVGVCCLGVATCFFLLSYRGVDGFSGGDAFAKVVMLAAAIAFLSNSDFVTGCVLVFISGQLVVAYSTPGWFRIFDRRWHDSTKIVGVMRTETYGQRWVYELLSGRPNFARAVSSGIAIWEALFVLYLFLPLPLLLPVLFIGVVFHSSNAVVMGLNIFPWSFIGSYPAFIWTSIWLRSVLASQGWLP